MHPPLSPHGQCWVGASIWGRLWFHPKVKKAKTYLISKLTGSKCRAKFFSRQTYYFPCQYLGTVTSLNWTKLPVLRACFEACTNKKTKQFLIPLRIPNIFIRKKHNCSGTWERVSQFSDSSVPALTTRHCAKYIWSNIIDFSSYLRPGRKLSSRAERPIVLTGGKS